MQLPDSPFNKRRLGPTVPRMILYRAPYMLIFRFLVRAKVGDGQAGWHQQAWQQHQHAHDACADKPPTCERVDVVVDLGAGVPAGRCVCGRCAADRLLQRSECC
jgi:hypothetical protein